MMPEPHAFHDEITALLAKGAQQEAIQLCKKTLRKTPTHPIALFYLASWHEQNHALPEAFALLQRLVMTTLSHNTYYWDGLVRLCSLENALYGPTPALKRLSAILEKLPLSHAYAAPLYCLQGGLFDDQKKTALALKSYQLATQADTNLVLAWRNLGVLQTQQNEFDNAEISLKKALALHPNEAATHYQLSRLYFTQGLQEKAFACINQAVSLDPSVAEHHHLRGLILHRMNVDPALVADNFAYALQLAPQNKEIRWNNCLCALNQGQWSATVWQDFERGWELGQRQSYPRPNTPLWRGEALIGKQLYLYDEQGLGDTLQFIRFLAHISALAPAKIYLRVQAPLARLLTPFAANHGAEILPQGALDPTHDYHCPLMSLPQALQLMPDHLNGKPYLTTTKQVAIKQTPSSLRIGIIWRGNPHNPIESIRAIPLQYMLQTNFAPHTVFSLQYQLTDTEKTLLDAHHIVDLSASWQNLADTAETFVTLDLIITCDSVGAHLAGALGIPSWVLIYQPNCWRWQHARNDSPWYDSLRLFRQTKPGDWSDVLSALSLALRPD